MGRSHPPLQLIASEANGARWPSRSSKSVAPRSRGEARFDSEALPPAFAPLALRRLSRRGLTADRIIKRRRTFPRDAESKGSRHHRFNNALTTASVSLRSSNTTSAPAERNAFTSYPPV